jgi:GT2 family glycosyltransferase
MPSLCVVIPATDGRITSERCVAAIRAAAQAADEIIVVNEPAGLGPAAARNEGARRASAEILVFVDSDVEVHADAFQRIRGAFDDDPGLIAVFGSYDDDPGAEGLVSDFRNLLHHHVHQSAAGPASTFWAGLGAIRRERFLAAGGFDERRFPRPSVEDIELGMRLASNGERILLDPAIQGKHLKRWTLGSMVRTDLCRRGAPWVRLLLDRGSGSTALNLGWRHRVSVLSSLLLVGSLGTRRPRLGVASLATILLLNHSFYLLLLRRRGWRQVTAGVPLHVVHHLVSAAAVPAGAVVYVHDRLFDSSKSSA